MPTFRKPVNGWYSYTRHGESRTRLTNGAGNWALPPNNPFPSPIWHFLPFLQRALGGLQLPGGRRRIIFRNPEPVCRAFPLMHCGVVRLFALTRSILLVPKEIWRIYPGDFYSLRAG